eukprot:jgi/Ulvmu1/7528/UM037_0072.1
MADSGEDGFSVHTDSGELRDELGMSEDLSEEDDSDVSLEMDGVQMDYPMDSDGDNDEVEWREQGPFLARVLVRNDAQERVPPADINSYKLAAVDPPVNRWTELFHAALAGKSDDMHRILSQGGDVLASADSFYPTTREFPRLFPPHEARELRLGVLHHICDPKQRTVLVYAAVSGNMDAVRELVPSDLSTCDTPMKRVALCGLLRRCDIFGRSVFHYVAHFGISAMFLYLLDTFEKVCGWPEFALGSISKPDIDVMPLSELSIPAKATRFTVLRHESRDLAPTVLCQAARQGHLDLTMKLLAKGATDISSREEPSSAVSDADLVAVAEQQPAQQCTAEDSDSALAADVDLTKSPVRPPSPPPPEADAVRDTALICAASGGHTLVLQALLASGKCDLEARGQFGETAIHRAAASKSGKDTMRLLVEAGANVDAVAEPPEGWSDDERWKLTMYWGGTALLRAAHVGDVDRVNLLLDKNVRIDVADCDLDTALHAAASALNLDVIKRLTSVIDDVMIAELLARVNNRGKCPLHCAVAGAAGMSPGSYRCERMRACVEVMEHLVAQHNELGVGLDIEDVDKATPLFEAARNGLESIVKILVAGGARPHNPAASGETPVTWAASDACVGMLRVLVDAGADVSHAHPRSKETPLHVAVLARKREEDVVAACKILIEAGADVNALNAEDRTPVSLAADLRKHKLLMLFLNHGGMLDWMSDAGTDAFQCLYGGQDPQARTYQIREAQQSAELCAKALKLCEGRDLLFVGSKINRALYENFSRIACTVLEAHKDRVDEAGNNLLMLATLRSWNNVVKEMVSMEGVNVEQRNKRGESAMMLACKEGAWDSFLDLYGAGAVPPRCANAELMVAASLHQWRRIEQILQRLVDEQDGSPRRVRTDRADTPVPDGPDASVSTAARDLPHHMMHVSPAVQAVSSRSARASVLSDTADDATAPPLKRRRPSGAMPSTASAVGHEVGAGSPCIPQTDAIDHVLASESNFTWLIAQLMGTREPDALRGGYPAIGIRDRILTLLRPMMNFNEKVAYFQEEQDRLLEYELDSMGDDETLHIEVHRGPEMLAEMVEQISKADDDMLRRELSVSFIGEDGEDGGGLLREFCAVCTLLPCQVRISDTASRALLRQCWHSCVLLSFNWCVQGLLRVEVSRCSSITDEATQCVYEVSCA